MPAFYTYVLIRPDGTPFYVGKGHGNRYLQCGGNKHAHRTANKIENSGQKIGLHQIPAESEEAAFIEEKRLIALYGRIDLGTGTLCNCSDGGEGISNPSIETRKKRAKHFIGNRWGVGHKVSKEHRAIISKVHKGKVVSIETRLKSSQTKLIRGPSKKQIEQLKRLHAENIGRKATSEHRNKISVANYRRWGTTPDDIFTLDTLPRPEK